jgi:hypothetical protein
MNSRRWKAIMGGRVRRQVVRASLAVGGLAALFYVGAAPIMYGT